MGPKKFWKGLKHIKRQRSRDECAAAASSSEAKPQSRDNDHDPPPKKHRTVFMNLSQVKGHQAVIGTCDIHHDRQAAAELIDLLNTFAEKIYEGESESSAPGSNSSPSVADTPEDETGKKEMKPSGKDAGLSVEELIRQEADALRAGSQESRKFTSVDTGVKGVTMVCIMDKRVDAVKLVDNIFSEIRSTHKRHTRFLQRVTPVAITSFAEIEAFKTAAREMISNALPPVADDVPFNTTPEAGAETGEAAAKPASTAAGAGSTSQETPGDREHDPLTDGRDGCGDQTDKIADRKDETAQHGDERDGKQGIVTETRSGTDTLTRTTSSRRWTFRVDPRRRNSGLSRKDLIDVAASFVGKGHSVTMKSPDVTIVVEAIKSMVGASVLFNYSLNREYSINRLQDAVCDDILKQ